MKGYVVCVYKNITNEEKLKEYLNLLQGRYKSSPLENSVPRWWVNQKSLQFLRKVKMLSEELIIIDKLKKRLNATVQQIGDSMMTGGVDSMEKYKYMLGQAHAYQLINQEISNLLKQDEKEQNDGNVIDIKGSTKN